MDVPGIVRERLGDERQMTSVNVGGDDRVYVTPPRTLVYHSAGLFSREEIEEFPHDAVRFDVSANRREASFAFEYDDGVRGFSTPRERIETVLPPVLAGVLRTTGRIAEDESVEESYRFGARTLVVTDRRLLTSVGEAVWEADSESYAYENITDLRFEDDALGLEVDGQSRQIELSGDGRREAYRTVEDALCAYHGVESVEQLPDLSQRADREQDGATEWHSPGGDTHTDRHEDDISEESGPATGTGTETAADTNPQPPERPSSPAPSGELASTPIREVSGSDTENDAPAEPTTDTASENVGDGVIEAEPTQATGTAGPKETAEPTRTDLGGELDALRETVERQTELLERQQATIERLVEELSYDQ